MWFIDILKEHYGIWTTNPIAFVTALAVGVAFGFLLSRLRHQGKIDALDERIKHRDDQIKLKDDTIQSLNTQIDKGTAEKPPTKPPTMALDEMPFNIKLHNALIKQKYLFVFNPQNGRNKILEFLESGDVGEGRNGNEWMWRIRNGKLEMINNRNEVYSRFRWNDEKGSLHHTNEPDTMSLRGQFMIPASSKEAIKLQNLQQA